MPKYKILLRYIWSKAQYSDPTCTHRNVDQIHMEIFLSMVLERRKKIS